MTDDDDGFEIDDSDYDIYIEEVNFKISLCICLFFIVLIFQVSGLVRKFNVILCAHI